MLTKTIAIIAEKEEYPLELLQVLAKQELQLLFVSSDQETNLRLIRQFDQLETVAEVDFISCEREGCWEADLIILYKPAKFLSTIIERIREVAIQKTILVISERNTQKNDLNIQELLPHSKVIDLELAELQNGILNTYFAVEEKKISDTLGY